MCTPTSRKNHPFVVWGSCFLWITSMFAIAWSLVLFFCIGDMLVLTGTDLINAMVLLSGIIMLPTNVYILCAIANGKTIDYKSKVVCCPLWLCIIWTVAINSVGAALCVHKIMICKVTTNSRLNATITHYRTSLKFKRFMDNLQWSLKCCGLNSYRDWFKNNWYDYTRDYEWDSPSKNHHMRGYGETKTYMDSVPFSCCKSGSCISNYLLELGTSSINTRGCGYLMYHIILTSMIIHFIMFVSVIVVELLILKFIIAPRGNVGGLCSVPTQSARKATTHNIRHIMTVNDNFSASSASLQLNPEDSDEFERVEQRPITPRYITKHSRSDYRDVKKADPEYTNSLKEGGWDDNY